MLLRLTINGRRESFGYYADEIEAAKAYDKAAKKYHSRFAGLNFAARGTGHKSRTNCFGQFFAVFVQPFGFSLNHFQKIQPRHIPEKAGCRHR